MSEILDKIVSVVWDWPLIITLTGGGLYLVFLSKLRILYGFGHAWKLILGKFHHKGDEQAHGQISHFKALTNALSATVGMGNVAGVAVAISHGGPGAIFWMWVSALIGMNTKFFECTLACIYRGKDHEGNYRGGPMFTITEGLDKKWHFLAYFFTICGMVGTLSIFNANQFTQLMIESYDFPPKIVAAILTAGVGVILLGGVTRISQVTSKVVPVMCVLYVICALGIIFMNIERVPQIFLSIFSDAFTGSAVVGGSLGEIIRRVFITGIQRATYSNEAGMGSAPMAHGDAKTSEPVAEGLVAMVGPFIDTILVCTMTALVILMMVSPEEAQGANGVVMTKMAFEKGYGQMGVHILAVAVALFSFSTLVGYANYNQKCWNFLFKGRGIFSNKFLYVGFYCGTVFYGSLFKPQDVINLMDIGVGLMVYPNMIATIMLAKTVTTEMNEYLVKYGLKKDEQT